MSKSCTLRCEIQPGIFSNEYLATIKTVESQSGGDSRAQVFADKVCFANVNAQQQTASLRATRVGSGPQKDTVVVVLPQPTIQNGPTVLVW